MPTYNVQFKNKAGASVQNVVATCAADAIRKAGRDLGCRIDPTDPHDQSHLLEAVEITEADRTAVRREVFDSLERQLEKVRAQQAAAARTLVQAGYVIRTAADPGVYLRIIGASLIGSGITRATRFTEESARALAPTIQNGHGQPASPVPLREALDAEARHLADLIDRLSTEYKD